jgi:hypothetical protein
VLCIKAQIKFKSEKTLNLETLNSEAAVSVKKKQLISYAQE